MDVIIGKLAGFCPGVENTIKKAKEILANNDTVYCLGEIVHNERVIADLEKKGMKTIHSIEEAKDNSQVIIRAHGEPIKTFNYLKEKGISKEGWEALVNKVLSKLDEYATNKDVELAVQEVIEEDDIL